MVIKHGVSSVVVNFQKFGIAFESSDLVLLGGKLCFCGLNLSTLLPRLDMTITLCLESPTPGVLLPLSRCYLKKCLGRSITRMFNPS